jgi:hypothetical protein
MVPGCDHQGSVKSTQSFEHDSGVIPCTWSLCSMVSDMLSTCQAGVICTLVLLLHHPSFPSSQASAYM